MSGAVTTYEPIGQTYVHVPATASSVPPGRHAVQPVAVPSVQAAQLAWHVAQLVPSTAYLPIGHVATHAPLSNRGVAPVALRGAARRAAR